MELMHLQYMRHPSIAVNVTEQGDSWKHNKLRLQLRKEIENAIYCFVNRRFLEIVLEYFRVFFVFAHIVGKYYFKRKKWFKPY